jgi:hypothetical protein
MSLPVNRTPRFEASLRSRRVSSAAIISASSKAVTSACEASSDRPIGAAARVKVPAGAGVRLFIAAHAIPGAVG